MRLIDADKLPIRIAHEVDETGTCADFLVVDKTEIDNTPTVEYQPVVYAHWVFNPNANDWGIGGWCCSNCHYKNDTLGISQSLPFPILMYAGTQYCGHCGAKMEN